MDDFCSVPLFDEFHTFTEAQRKEKMHCVRRVTFAASTHRHAQLTSSSSTSPAAVTTPTRTFLSRLVAKAAASTESFFSKTATETFAGDPNRITELRRPFEKRKAMPESLAERIAMQKQNTNHTQPAAIRVSKDKKYLTIQWDVDGQGNVLPSTRLIAELLRIESPSTDVKGTPEVLIYGRRGITIVDVVPIGRYALRLVFSDGHTGGIFPYEYLQMLGKEKFKFMRHYIARLKEKKKSRDPPKRVPSRQVSAAGESLRAKRAAEASHSHQHGPGCKHH